MTSQELFDAISRDDVKDLRRLLQAGIRINAQSSDFDNNSPLHVASQYGRIDMIQLLLDAKADVNAKGRYDSTPLHLAVQYNHPDVIKLLLDMKADVNAKKNYNWTPLHVAAEHNHLGVIKLLLGMNADVNARDNDDWTPLHVAAEYNHPDVIKLLLDRNADVNAKDNDDWTPLHVAAEYNHPDVIKLLLDRNADVNAKDNDDLTPLHVAAEYNHPDVIKLLLDRNADVNAKDNDERTHLHVAAKYNHPDVIKLLLDTNADVNANDNDERTPLHVAAKYNHPDVIKLLLDTNADVNAKDNDERTPLHVAAQHNHPEVIKLLFETNADVNVKDNDEWTPLHVAAQYNYPEVIKLLLETNADVNAKKKDDCTPLHVAAQYNHPNVIKLLLDTNADVNARDNDECTPLHVAAPHNHPDVIKLLLDMNADVNARKNYDWTPLHVAAQHNHPDVIKLLLNMNADVNARKNYYSKPLHVAAQRNHLNVIKLLLDMNADVNARNNDDRTPLHITAQHNHPDVIKLLLEMKADVNAKENSGKTAIDIATGDSKQVLKDWYNVPREIKQLGNEAIRLFHQSLRKDAVPANVVRCMFVGHYGVGKTTLVNSLLGKKRHKTKSTDGIDIHIGKVFVNKKTMEWFVQGQHSERVFGMDGYIQIHFWDFAGQLIYYTTHQTYLSPRCLFIIVFNALLGLKGIVQDDNLDPYDKSKKLVIEYIQFWVSTITTYAKNDKEGFPKIVIIGTHIDKLMDRTRIPEMIEHIKTAFKPLIDSEQLIVRQEFFVNAFNMDNDTTGVLRNMILSLGMSYPEYGQMIPRSWNLLHEILRKAEKIIPFQQIESMNSNMDVPLDSKELYLSVNFLHGLGYVLFFPDENLREKIIVDPKWIIDAMKAFVTRKATKVWRSTEWKMMRNTGKVPQTHFEEVLMKTAPSPRDHHHLLETMKKLDLITEPKMYEENGTDAITDFYYIPCMVHNVVSNTALQLTFNDNTAQVWFVFNDILPPAVYNRLICSTLSLWQVFEDHIYDGLVLLRSGPMQLIALKREYKQIRISIAHLQNEDDNDPCLCRTIVQFVQKSLQRILSIYNIASGDNQPLYEVKYNAVAENLKVQQFEEKGPKDFDDDCPVKCIGLTSQEKETIVDDKFLMRLALRLDVNHQYHIAACISNQANQLVTSYKTDYSDLKTAHHTWMMLTEWKETILVNKDTPTVAKVKAFLEDVEDVDNHILCKVCRQLDKHPSGLETSFQQTEVYCEQLDAVSDRIDDRYIQVGTELGLTKAAILRIRQSHRNDTLKLIRAIFQEWHKVNQPKGKATIVNLATALLNARSDMSVLYLFEKEKKASNKGESSTKKQAEKCSVS